MAKVCGRVHARTRAESGGGGAGGGVGCRITSQEVETRNQNRGERVHVSWALRRHRVYYKRARGGVTGSDECILTSTS